MNSIQPGRIDEAEGLAAALLSLAASQARYDSGTVLPVDGSFQRFPL